jgi:hypothetical protein
MQRTKRLRKLRMALKWRLYRLEKRLKGLSPTSDRPEREIVVSYVAIEALNAWAMFSRSFYLSLALNVVTERNKKITLTTPAADHLGEAIKYYKRYAAPNSAGVWHRRDEPAWHDPNVLMTVCQNRGCSIQTQLVASFSLAQNVFKDLPVCRNFFAHRNESSSQAARNIAPRYTLPTFLSPCDLLLSASPGTSVSVMLAWMDEMNVTAEFICKA